MPIVEKIMGNLKKQYGKKKGKSIYYALENLGKIKPKRKTNKKK